MFKATLPEPPLPPPATAAAAPTQRRLVPPAGLTTSILRGSSDDEVDAELRHLGISFTGITNRLENHKMIIDHYDRARRISAEQQQLFDKGRAKSRGISDKLISDLVKSSAIPLVNVRAIADWSVIIPQDEL